MEIDRYTESKISKLLPIIVHTLIGFMVGFLTALYIAGNRVEPTPEYKHWQLEQRGHYSYCPYCGEELKEIKNE